MKQFLYLLTILVLLPLLAVPVCATEEEAPPVVTECTHVWSEGMPHIQPTCQSEGQLYYQCQLCGAGRYETIPPVTTHQYSHWSKMDDSTHMCACIHCGIQQTAAHEWDSGSNDLSTCTTPGQTRYYCHCGAQRSDPLPIDPNNHTYGPWEMTETSHFRTCTGCGQTADQGSHVWDGGYVSVPPTCVSEGVRAYGCSVCSGVLVEVIPRLTTCTYDNPCDPDCNFCGATRNASHNFSTTLSKNAQGHWYACTKCGEKKGMESHVPGPAATEEKAQLCLTCGYTLTARKNHTHSYSSHWTSDESGHWYACGSCEEQKDFAEHTFDDECDPDCGICGYVRSTAHVYDGTWLSDAQGHWGKCTLCQTDGEVQPHQPGPEATETDPQLCQICNYEITPVIEHVHEALEQWSHDEENHWKNCACEEQLELAPHSWDAGTENPDTTVTYICTQCSLERTEGEPKDPSAFPWGIVLAGAFIAVLAAAAALFFLLKPKTTGKYSRRK